MWKEPRLQVYIASALTCMLIGGGLGFIAGYGVRSYRSSDVGASSMPAALSSIPPIGSGTPSAPKIAWDVTEERSPVDDSPTVILSIGTDKPTTNRFGSESSNRLIIRCREHQTDVYIATDEYIGSEGTRVITRIDNGASESETWSHSTDGKAVFSPRPIPLARTLAKSQKLFARVSDFNGTSYDVEFKLAGLDSLLPKVTQACS
jgi:type VI secretion system protein VasI